MDKRKCALTHTHTAHTHIYILQRLAAFMEEEAAEEEEEEAAELGPNGFRFSFVYLYLYLSHFLCCFGGFFKTFYFVIGYFYAFAILLWHNHKSWTHIHFSNYFATKSHSYFHIFHTFLSICFRFIIFRLGFHLRDRRVSEPN